MLRQIASLLALIALGLVALPVAAPAAGKPEIRLLKPPGLDMKTLIGVIKDGKIDANDAADIGFQALWSKVGDGMEQIDLCWEARRERAGRKDPYTFEVKVTVTDGDDQTSFQQTVKVIPTSDNIYAILLPKPGGGYIKTFWCGNTMANPPPPESLDGESRGGDDRHGGDGGPGLDLLRFSTPQGQVAVWLPDDIRAGDTISGTVITTPAGRSDAERTANSDTLSGYVVDVGGAPAPVKNGRLQFVVPPASAGVVVTLLGPSGTASGQTVVLSPNTAPPPSRIALPPYGQASRPLVISGPFDGNAQNTTVVIGGRDIPLLAESPRSAVTAPPQGDPGKTTIAVRDGAQHAEGSFRNIGISLTSPKTTLLRGEKTEVHMQVQGLEGIQTPVPLRIEASPSVLLEGGNVQLLQVRPRDVRSGGLFVLDLNLQAVTEGGFNVTARVVTPEPKNDKGVLGGILGNISIGVGVGGGGGGSSGQTGSGGTQPPPSQPSSNTQPPPHN